MLKLAGGARNALHQKQFIRSVLTTRLNDILDSICRIQ